MLGILAKRNLFKTANRFMSGSAAQHAGGMDLWRKLSLFGALPSCAILMVYVYLEHTAHHEAAPEYIQYDHLRKRDKRFPWGDGTRSLFHNSHVQWHPDEQEQDH